MPDVLLKVSIFCPPSKKIFDIYSEIYNTFFILSLKKILHKIIVNPFGP